MKTIVGITGTTSVGKSRVAVNLAKHLDTEIISADSMQIYKGMDIGTAKISINEMAGVTHHMIDVVEPNCNYSSFLYQRDASKIIDSMQSTPIVVGGTGFYFDSLLYPPEFGSADENKRAELHRILDNEGLTPLQEQLKNLDSQTYSTIDLRNPQRLIRAIEIAQGGKKKSHGKGKIKPKYDMKLFVLQRNRLQLYQHIDKRVDEMVQNGLVDEVKKLVDTYGACDTTAFSAIGYKEIIDYLRGNTTLKDAIDKIKLNTRHYAKRQITYFKKMNVTEFVDVDGKTTEEIAEYIYKKAF